MMNRLLTCVFLILISTVFSQAANSKQLINIDSPVLLNKLSSELLSLQQLSYPLTAIIEFNIEVPQTTHSKFNKDSIADRTARRTILKHRAAMIRNGKKHLINKLKSKRRLKRDFTQLAMSSITISNVEELIELLKDPSVKKIHPDVILTKSLLQSNPLIKADTVYNSLGVSGAGTSVVVLDTGVDYTLSEFGSCASPASSATCRVAEAFDIATEDNLLDDDGHGTNVAAIVAGVASKVDLIVLDVFDGETASGTDVIAGIDWAIANQVLYNISAINMSLGGDVKFPIPCVSGFGNPIASAKSIGIASVASSGNDGYSDGFPSPACVPEAISVGAVYDANVGGLTFSNCNDSTTMVDQITCFSNSATFLDLLAPGALINAGGINLAGTSQAAPHVSAAMALLSAAYPGESVDTKLARLKNNGTLIMDARNGLSFPRIDILSAIGAINDDFYNALILNGVNGSITLNSKDATPEVNEPLHSGISNYKSVWFEYLSDKPGLVSIDTIDSTYNTVISIYVGSDVTNLTEVNSETVLSQNTTTTNFFAEQNTTYKIVVVDPNDVGGELILNYTFEEVSVENIPAMNYLFMFKFALLLILIQFGLFRIKRT